MASSSSPEPVQPSPPLLAALHRRLRDPSLVSSFERRRPRSATAGLVRPRWTLRRPGVDGDGPQDGGGGGAGAADKSDAKKGDGSDGVQGIGRGCTVDAKAGGASARPPNHNPPPTNNCNALPRRSYIDLRLEQNKLFADAQHIICRTKLAAYLPSSNPGRKKHIDAFRSALAEGLAACPHHEGLLRVEREWKARRQEEKEGCAVAGGDGGTEAAQLASRPNLANPRADGGTTTANGDNPTTHSLPPRKGAEGRARAAMQDALMERAFLLGGGDGAMGEKAAGMVRYPLLAEKDELTERGGRQTHKSSRRESSSDSSSSSSDDSRSRRRRKKRSRRRRKKHKRRGKRRRRDGEDKRQSKGERRRERSRSRSRSSSMSSRSSSHRRRKRRKEKKRRRKHRHRSRNEGPSDDDRESKTSVDEVGSGAN